MSRPLILRLSASLALPALLAGVLLTLSPLPPFPDSVVRDHAKLEPLALPEGRPTAPVAAPVVAAVLPAPPPIAQPTVPAKPATPVAPAKPAATPAVPVLAAENPPELEPAPTPAGTRTETYTAQRGDSVPGLAHRYLGQSSWLTSAELEAAIRAANPALSRTYLKPGESVLIPDLEAGPVVERPQPVDKDFEVRAVYLTGVMAGSEHGQRIIREWRKLGGNAVVFDIKDSDGAVNIPFQHPLAPARRGHPIPNLAKFMRWVHAQGMHGIARIAIFRDERLVVDHPALAVRSRHTGQPWRENGKLVWTDPSREEVQQYDIALARTAIAGGVDEVQFDYVRFPAEGDQKDASFAFQAEHPDWTRADVIADFLAKAYAQVHARGVLLSLDVFGVMAWQRPVDLGHTGQDIVRMAGHCDVLSPMIYPSHFFGMDGYALPGDAPEHFIAESMERFRKITEGSGVVLRPWLQAFAWRTRTYSPQYVVTQVVAAREKGGIGFLFWNARNDYSKPLLAMATMRQSPGKYFRGDEVRSGDPALPAGNPAQPAPAAPVVPASSSAAAQGLNNPTNR